MTWKRFVLLFSFAVMAILTGCTERIEPGLIGSEVWEEMPSLTYGVMESAKPEILLWNNGRCEATARYAMAETENGYYLARDGYLYYADKANLNNWVLVCNQPDCEHWNQLIHCKAWMGSTAFAVKDGRIYCSEDIGLNPDLYHGKGNGYILVSRAQDGTDKELAYVINDALLPDAGSVSDLFDGKQWLYLSTNIDASGKGTPRFFRVTDSGTQEIEISPKETFLYLMSTRADALNGESLFYSNAPDDGPGYYRFKGDTLQKADLSGYDTYGIYLSGNIVRFFRSNDGYYDVNLDTREEVRLAPAALENSDASIVLPNVIVESTLLNGNAVKTRSADAAHRMVLYNGEVWTDVSLPKELESAGTRGYLQLLSVTSDSIFFAMEYFENTDYSTPIYRIVLDDDTPALELAGVLIVPHEIEDEEDK